MQNVCDISKKYTLDNCEPHVGAVYKHYKGNYYKILAIGTHSESLERCVIYQALEDCPQFGEKPVWVRPLEMFMGTLIIDGLKTQRFSRVE